jgi:hypothetical protein
VGGEFLAARQALIEQLKAAAAPRAGTADEGHGAGAGNGAAAVRDSSWSSQGSGAAAGSDTRSATAAAAASSQPDERQQRRGKEPWRDGPNWLQLSVAADRPIEQTLMGMWGALGPWQRVCILWDVASMLVWKVGVVRHARMPVTHACVAPATLPAQTSRCSYQQKPVPACTDKTHCRLTSRCWMPC